MGVGGVLDLTTQRSQLELDVKPTVLPRHPCMVFNIRDKLGLGTRHRDKNEARQKIEVAKLQACKGQALTSRCRGLGEPRRRLH